MRSESTAIWTSGEPVSESLRRCSLMSSAFLSSAIVMVFFAVPYLLGERAFRDVRNKLFLVFVRAF